MHQIQRHLQPPASSHEQPSSQALCVAHAISRTNCRDECLDDGLSPVMRKACYHVLIDAGLSCEGGTQNIAKEAPEQRMQISQDKPKQSTYRLH